MKSINEFLNEYQNNMITEADCKDLLNARKGCNIYAIEVGKEEKVYKLTLSNIVKRKDPGASWRTNKYGKTHYNDMTFAENPLGITEWSILVFGGVNYGDGKSVETVHFDDKTVVFGINKQVLIDYVKSEASKKSISLAKEIEELQEKLVDLEAKKAKQDAIIAAEISESLNK